MKKIFSLLLALVYLVGPLSASAAIRVRGYVKPKTGSYVFPSYRSSPNRSLYDNYSTKGNYNPYTGKIGTKSPYKY